VVIALIVVVIIAILVWLFILKKDDDDGTPASDGTGTSDSDLCKFFSCGTDEAATNADASDGDGADSDGATTGGDTADDSETYELQNINEAERKEFVSRTNMYRCMHGSPALKWNQKLYLNTEETFGKATAMEHSASYDLTDEQGGPAGENLFGGSVGGGWTPTQMVDLWYNEVADCIWWPQAQDLACSKGKGNKVVGHFTALIWKGTTVIACTKSENGAIGVCRYGNGPGGSLSCNTPNMGGCYEDNV